MTDKNETKLEGDDAITLAMINVQRATHNGRKIFENEWNDRSYGFAREELRDLLAYVREHLVKPAVEAAVADKNREVTGLLGEIDKLTEIRNELRRRHEELKRTAKDANRRACDLRESTDKHWLARREAEKENVELRKRCEELEAQLGDARRDGACTELRMLAMVLRDDLATDLHRSWKEALGYCLHIVEVRLEAHTVPATPSAQLPKAGEPVEVRNQGPAGYYPWRSARVDQHYHGDNTFDFTAADGTGGTRNMEDENKTWRRVQPQPETTIAELSAPESSLTASQAMGCALSIPMSTTEMGECQRLAPGVLEHLKRLGWVLCRCIDTPQPEKAEPPECPPGMVQWNDCPECGKPVYLPANCGFNGTLVHPECSDKYHSRPSEPPPEVQTQELDALTVYLAPPVCSVANGAPRQSAVHLVSDVHAAYRRDLAAGIAQATERLRKELETSKRLVLRVHDSWQVAEAARANLETENDDLRRQLREQGGECAACGCNFQDTCWYVLDARRVVSRNEGRRQVKGDIVDEEQKLKDEIVDRAIDAYTLEEAVVLNRQFYEKARIDDGAIQIAEALTAWHLSTGLALKEDLACRRAVKKLIELRTR